MNVADQQPANLYSILASAAAAAVLGLTAWLSNRPRGDGVVTARAISLDRTQEAIITGLRAENARKDVMLELRSTEASNWQAAARGMDEIARDQYHTMSNAYQAGTKLTDPPGRVPKLESFFDAHIPAA